MKLKKGLLVVFEGIDGSGKTTQAKLLFEYLKKKGLDVILSKEPTNSVFGEKIMELANGERDFVRPIDEYNLFLNDRKVHVENLIKPALKEKKIIVLDRYYFSTIAYQGALGLDPKKIKAENESFAPRPEIVFLISLKAQVGLSRIKNKRNEDPNLFEREENLNKVNRIFNSLKEDYIVNVEGMNQIGDIHKTIIQTIETVLADFL